MPSQYATSKIARAHLERCAYVYVRQSTQAQVRENTASAQRQYDLIGVAATLGWSHEKIVVVDQDQGRSGASVAGRDGFNVMLSQIALGNVGAVISLEASRLARDTGDWHHLIKICAVTNTLIIDEHGVGDPNDPDDRLLLGFKGTLSEGERELIMARMRGARERKAKDGLLRLSLPIGYTRDEGGKTVFDPDQEVQNAVRMLFDAFDESSSVCAAVRALNNKGALFPVGPHGKLSHGGLKWMPLRYSRALEVLRNPTYAGAYVYGRSKSVAHIDLGGSPEVTKRVKKIADVDGWMVKLLDHHPGYITWEKYIQNRRRIGENRNQLTDGAVGAARAGAALLQGLILCGQCGRRVQVRYLKGKPNFAYYCRGVVGEFAGPGNCTHFRGGDIDGAVTRAVLDAIKPASVKVSVAAVGRFESELHKVKLQMELRLEKAQAETELARRRYMSVDPENRLAARSLEKDWDTKLSEMARLEREREEAERSLPRPLSQGQREAVLALSKDLPRVWRAETTTQVERKQLMRLLIKEVTAHRTGMVVHLSIRWQTGAYTQLHVPLKSATEVIRTDPATVDIIRKLAADRSDQEVADYLNSTGSLSRWGRRFTRRIVLALRKNYGIPCEQSSHPDRVPRRDGRVSATAASKVLKVNRATVINRCKAGKLDGVQGGGRKYWLVKLTPEAIAKLSRRRPRP